MLCVTFQLNMVIFPLEQADTWRWKHICHHWVAGSSTGSDANISGQGPTIHSFLLCFRSLISHCIMILAGSRLPSGYVKNGHWNSDFSHSTWWFSIVRLVYQRWKFRVGCQDPTPPTYAFLGASSSRWPTSRKAKARRIAGVFPPKMQNGDLLGGLKPWNFMTFHSVGNVIIPTDEVIFFRGVGQPPISDFFGGKDAGASAHGYFSPGGMVSLLGKLWIEVRQMDVWWGYGIMWIYLLVN